MESDNLEKMKLSYTDVALNWAGSQFWLLSTLEALGLKVFSITHKHRSWVLWGLKHL